MAAVTEAVARHHDDDPQRETPGHSREQLAIPYRPSSDVVVIDSARKFSQQLPFVSSMDGLQAMDSFSLPLQVGGARRAA